MKVINAEEKWAKGDTYPSYANLCFSCGTCSAICPLGEEGFPRKYMRYVQIGAYNTIVANHQDLWKCLHCGLCTATCPRGARPGEVILELKNLVLNTLRRKSHV